MMSPGIGSLNWGGMASRRPPPDSARRANGARRTWLLLITAAVLPLRRLGGIALSRAHPGQYARAGPRHSRAGGPTLDRRTNGTT